MTDRFQFEGNLITLTVSTTGAGLVTGALEDDDDDDNDDTTTRNFDWVLSFRDKPKLNILIFKLAVTIIPAKSAKRSLSKNVSWRRCC
jgi:hypothetical protein